MRSHARRLAPRERREGYVVCAYQIACSRWTGCGIMDRSAAGIPVLAGPGSALSRRRVRLRTGGGQGPGAADGAARLLGFCPSRGAGAGPADNGDSNGTLCGVVAALSERRDHHTADLLDRNQAAIGEPGQRVPQALAGGDMPPFAQQGPGDSLARYPRAWARRVRTPSRRSSASMSRPRAFRVSSVPRAFRVTLMLRPPAGAR